MRFRVSFSLIAIVGSMFLASLNCSCGKGHKGDESQLRRDVDSFATFFFNYRFVDAARFCTPESRAWLSFAASNVKREDVEQLRQMEHGAGIEILQVVFEDDNDTTATVSLTVRNCYINDSIGKGGHVEEEFSCPVSMVFRAEKWLVKMEDLPQNER